MVRTVLVTGANWGIGLHTALLGFAVVGTVRFDDKAETVAEAASDAGVVVETAVLDVTDAGRAEALVREREPSAVVNNAGSMNLGQVVDVAPEEALLQLDAMVVAPLRLATLAVPIMRRRGEGRIVNVSSVVASVTIAMMGWYQAAKHALSAVTDALRGEVAVDGIDVVLIEPGGLHTPIWDKATGALEVGLGVRPGRREVDDLRRRRKESASPRSYDRSLRIVRAGRPLMPAPSLVVETIGTALTAGRPRARYRVGAGAAVIPLVEAVVPEPMRDRIARAVLAS